MYIVVENVIVMGNNIEGFRKFESRIYMEFVYLFLDIFLKELELSVKEMLGLRLIVVLFISVIVGDEFRYLLWLNKCGYYGLLGSCEEWNFIFCSRVDGIN